MVSDKRIKRRYGSPKASRTNEFTASNAVDAWDKWAARFPKYFKAAELKKKDADVQVAILLELAGSDSG